MQSTLTSLMSFSFNVVAASSYSGARALQWPHQGAKTGGRRVSRVVAKHSMGSYLVDLHSARTRPFSVTKAANSSFLSWITSEAASAADATAAAASKPRAMFRAERMVASCCWYGGSAIKLSRRQDDEQEVWPGSLGTLRGQLRNGQVERVERHDREMGSSKFTFLLNARDPREGGELRRSYVKWERE